MDVPRPVHRLKTKYWHPVPMTGSGYRLQHNKAVYLKRRKLTCPYCQKRAVRAVTAIFCSTACKKLYSRAQCEGFKTAPAMKKRYDYWAAVRKVAMETNREAYKVQNRIDSAERKRQRNLLNIGQRAKPPLSGKVVRYPNDCKI